MFNRVSLKKASRVIARKTDALWGRLLPLQPTLRAMEQRPYELHLELTNLCNANCVFCPYQYQQRPTEFMSEEVFRTAVDQFVALGGGSVGLTPIVGDALIHPDFVNRVRYLRTHEAIDRIWLTTNAILVNRHGAAQIIDSGLTSITVSTSGFEADSYRRIYRSTAYRQMRDGVLALCRENERYGRPVHLTIGLRSNRPLEEVLRDPDFEEILAFKPEIDFTWSFTSAGGRIRRDTLPTGFRLRQVRSRPECCVQLYNGPIILPDGTIMACSCVAAVDAVADLGIGNILDHGLLEAWHGERMRSIRAGFLSSELNPTCAKCDIYRDLSLYRTREGRERARISSLRGRGIVVRRTEAPGGAFSGG